MNKEEVFKKQVEEAIAHGRDKIRILDSSAYQWNSGYADWLMDNYKTEDCEGGFYALITNPLTPQH